MKSALFILFVLITCNTIAQVPLLQKLWVGPDSTYMRANGKRILFETFTKRWGAINESVEYNLIGDTLRVTNPYTSQAPQTGAFLMDTLTKNKLKLTPLDNMAGYVAGALTKNNVLRQVTYKDVKQIYTDTIKFEKIIFKQQGGYPGVQTLTYEVDEKGNFKMFREKTRQQLAMVNLPADVAAQMEKYGGKSPADGYFTAKVPGGMLKQLTELLKKSDLDKLPAKAQRNIDVPDHIIEVHYNHKVKYIIAGWMPMIVQPLNEFLVCLPEMFMSKPTTQNPEIKFSHSE